MVVTAKRITRIALFSAILYISKLALESVPNVELVSFLIIVYTLVFGWESIIATCVFNLCEVAQWGLGTWVITYIYVWPLLAIITMLLKKVIKEEFLVWAIVSGMFGLIFGSMFAILYIPVDPHYALTYWLSGLPWDVWHCIANFIIMLILGKPVTKVLKKIKVMSE